MLEILLAACRISTPYTLAATGGLLSERAGVANIALEGTLLMGALAHATVTLATGNPWLGLLAAAGGGLLTMALHALLCVRVGANHIMVGVGINLLAMGLGRFVLKLLYNSASNGPRTAGFEDTFWQPLTTLPVLGGALTTPLVVLAPVLVALVAFVLQRTPWGLRVRAVGEHPGAAATQGVSVWQVRWTALLAGGICCGLGGAYLAADQHQFTHGMSAGRGFIALSAVVFGGWRPWRAFGACLLFGLAESFQIHLQGTGGAIPSQFVQMIPYLLTLLVLAVGRRSARAPAALGLPWPTASHR